MPWPEQLLLASVITPSCTHDEPHAASEPALQPADQPASASIPRCGWSRLVLITTTRCIYASAWAHRSVYMTMHTCLCSLLGVHMHASRTTHVCMSSYTKRGSGIVTNDIVASKISSIHAHTCLSAASKVVVRDADASVEDVHDCTAARRARVVVLGVGALARVDPVDAPRGA